GCCAFAASGHAAEQREEGASSYHSMTSSARASKVSGTVRPSALAVLRLITSSNLVGTWTGSSAGLSPLRMRSVYEAARLKRSLTSTPYVIRPPARVMTADELTAGTRYWDVSRLIGSRWVVV